MYRFGINSIFGCVLGSIIFFTLPANALENAGKERLFRYGEVIKSEDGGLYRVIDYNEKRDIDRRDKVPERRVNSQYVDNRARKATAERVLETVAGQLRYFATGQENTPRVVTIYMHGAGGDGAQGANDYSFGGNFNRIKALMVANRGVFLTPDGGKFGESDFLKLKALVASVAQGGQPVILACGSAGGAMCYRAAKDADLAPRLNGLMLLGSFADETYPQSIAGKLGVPVFIAHGSRDTVIPVEGQEAFYRSLRAAGVRTMMVRFETGTHGTPIRMTDWRETLNWLLGNN